MYSDDDEPLHSLGDQELVARLVRPARGEDIVDRDSETVIDTRRIKDGDRLLAHTHFAERDEFRTFMAGYEEHCHVAAMQIWRGVSDVLPVSVQLAHPPDEQRHERKLLAGNREETLDGLRVQVDRDDVRQATLARGADDIGNELGHDDGATAIVLFLPCIAHVGEHERHLFSHVLAAASEHDEQVHELEVHVRTGVHDYEDMLARKHTLRHQAVHLRVAELRLFLFRICFQIGKERNRDPEAFGNCRRHRRAKPASKNADVVQSHDSNPPFMCRPVVGR